MTKKYEKPEIEFVSLDDVVTVSEEELDEGSGFLEGWGPII